MQFFPRLIEKVLIPKPFQCGGLFVFYARYIRQYTNDDFFFTLHLCSSEATLTFSTVWGVKSKLFTCGKLAGVCRYFDFYDEKWLMTKIDIHTI